MLLGLIILVLLVANWFFSHLFGFWPDDFLQWFDFVFGDGAIAVIIVLFSWGFGD